MGERFTTPDQVLSHWRLDAGDSYRVSETKSESEERRDRARSRGERASDAELIGSGLLIARVRQSRVTDEHLWGVFHAGTSLPVIMLKSGQGAAAARALAEALDTWRDPETAEPFDWASDGLSDRLRSPYGRDLLDQARGRDPGERWAGTAPAGAEVHETDDGQQYRYVQEGSSLTVYAPGGLLIARAVSRFDTRTRKEAWIGETRDGRRLSGRWASHFVINTVQQHLIAQREPSDRDDLWIHYNGDRAMVHGIHRTDKDLKQLLRRSGFTSSGHAKAYVTAGTTRPVARAQGVDRLARALYEEGRAVEIRADEDRLRGVLAPAAPTPEGAPAPKARPGQGPGAAPAAPAEVQPVVSPQDLTEEQLTSELNRLETKAGAAVFGGALRKKLDEQIAPLKQERKRRVIAAIQERPDPGGMTEEDLTAERAELADALRGYRPYPDVAEAREARAGLLDSELGRRASAQFEARLPVLQMTDEDLQAEGRQLHKDRYNYTDIPTRARPAFETRSTAVGVELADRYLLARQAQQTAAGDLDDDQLTEALDHLRGNRPGAGEFAGHHLSKLRVEKAQDKRRDALLGEQQVRDGKAFAALLKADGRVEVKARSSYQPDPDKDAAVYIEGRRFGDLTESYPGWRAGVTLGRSGPDERTARRTEALRWLIDQYEASPETRDTRTWGRIAEVELPPAFVIRAVETFTSLTGKAELYLISRLDGAPRSQTFDEHGNKLMAHFLDLPERTLPVLEQLGRRLVDRLDEELDSRDTKTRNRAKSARPNVLRGLDEIRETMQARGLRPLTDASAGAPHEGDTDDERVRDDSPSALGDVPAQGAGPDRGPGGVLPRAGSGRAAADRGADPAEDGRSDGGDGPSAAGGQAEGGPADVPGAGAQGDRVPGAGGGTPGRGAAPEVTGPPAGTTPPVPVVFRPTSQEDLAPAGERPKAAANLEAVRVLKRVGEEQRAPTTVEQQTLARWSGWGAVPAIFTTRPREDDPVYGSGGERESGYANAAARWESFADVRDPLRALLDDEEWRAAAASTLSAHYTPPEITSALWQALADLGFNGGEVLEPGSGSGVTFGTAPDTARLTGVEIDSTSAAISRLLAPGVTVLNESFADTVAPDGSFDGVVGNVPFARVKLYDPKHNRGRHRIHNHFLVKSVALTRPGGIVALIASSYVMDAEDGRARAELFESADLLGAVRLPRKVFARSAETEVFADILVLRRRMDGEEPGDRTWLNVQRRQLDEHLLPVNDYFINQPAHVLGTLTSRMGRLRPEVAVYGDPNIEAPLRTALRQITDSAVLARRGYTPHPEGPHRPHLRLKPAADLQDFSGRLSADAEGKLWQTTGDGEQAAVDLPDEQHTQLAALIELKDLVRGLNELDRTGSEPALAAAQRRLTKQTYERYVAAHGPLSRPKQQQNTTTQTDGGDSVTGLTAWGHFLNDPQAYEVLALEMWEADTKTVHVSEILDHAPAARRSVLGQHTDDPQQALDAVVAERGHVDLPHIAWMLQTDEQEARRRLGRAVFTDPLTGDLLYSADYLSGDVRTKLEIARQAARRDEAFTVNIAELERVQPREMLPGQFKVRLGAAWLPDDLVQQFFREYLGDGHLTVQHSGNGNWHILKGRGLSEEDEIKHSAGGLHPLALLNRVLNGGSMTGRPSDDEEAARAVRVKADEWRDAFETWALDDSARAARIAEVYNRQMNNRVVRDFTGTRPSLAGLDPDFTPYDHQLSAAARMGHERCLVLSHVVGAGKTGALAIGMMAMKNTGQIDKPLVAVPNYLVEQWESEVRRLFPAARILTLTSADLADGKRDRMLQYVRANSFDMIIMSHSLFDSIPLSPEFYEFYQDDELRRMDAQIIHERRREGKSISLKQLEERRQNHEQELKRRADAHRTPGQVYIDDLGLDFIAVDEAHEYKNLAVRSKIPGARVSGSAKAQHLHAVMEWARQNKPTGPMGCLATGTPLSNAIGELHSLALLAYPDLLRDLGIEEFDAFATMYGKMVERLEMTVDGKGFKSVERFASYHSVNSLLRQLWLPLVDYKDEEDLGLPLPQIRGGEPELMLVPATAEQQALMQELGDRYEAYHQGDVDKSEDNPLSINTDARVIALDPRLIDSEAEPGNKLRLLADRVAAEYHETKNTRYTYSTEDLRPHPEPGGLQMVFLNQGTPGGKNRGNFNAYQEFKNLLLARDVPTGKIDFIHDAKRADQRRKLVHRANHGGSNVLIGSTLRMGKGLNAQNRCTTVYHVDPDFRPADMKQKDGRGRRKGNQNKFVGIVWVATNGTFDSRMYGTLATKAKGFDQVYKAKLDAGTDEIEELDEALVPYEEAQAIISGNPYLTAREDMRKKLRTLTLDQNNRATQRAIVFGKLRQLTQEIDTLTRDINQRRIVLPTLLPVLGDDFQITVGGITYTKHKDAAAPLVDGLAGVLRNLPEKRALNPDTTLGQLGGRGLVAVAFRDDHDEPFVRVHLDGLPGSLHRFSTAELGDLKGETLLRRLTKTLTEAPERQIQDEGNRTAKRATRDDLLVYSEQLRGQVPGLGRVRERLGLVDALVAAQVAVNKAGEPGKDEPSAAIENRRQAVERRDNLQQQLDHFDATPPAEASPEAGEALLDLGEFGHRDPAHLSPQQKESEAAILRAHAAVHGDPDGAVADRLASLGEPGQPLTASPAPGAPAPVGPGTPPGAAADTAPPAGSAGPPPPLKPLLDALGDRVILGHIGGPQPTTPGAPETAAQPSAQRMDAPSVPAAPPTGEPEPSADSANPGPEDGETRGTADPGDDSAKEPATETTEPPGEAGDPSEPAVEPPTVEDDVTRPAAEAPDAPAAGSAPTPLPTAETSGPTNTESVDPGDRTTDEPREAGGDPYGTADLYEAFGLTPPERVTAARDEPEPEPEPEAEGPVGLSEGQMLLEEDDHGRERLRSSDGRLAYTLFVPPGEGVRADLLAGWQRTRHEFLAQIDAYETQSGQSPQAKAKHLARWRRTLKGLNGLEPFRPLPALRLTRRTDAPGLTPASYGLGSWLTWRDVQSGEQVTGQVTAPGAAGSTWFVSTDRSGHTGEYHVLSRTGKKDTGYTYSLNGAVEDLRPADGPGEPRPLDELPQVDSVPYRPVPSYADWLPPTGSGLAQVREPVTVTVGPMETRSDPVTEVAFDVVADGIPFVVTLGKHDESLTPIYLLRVEADGVTVAELGFQETPAGAVAAAVRVARRARELADKPLYARYRNNTLDVAEDGVCARCFRSSGELATDAVKLYRVNGGDPACAQHTASAYEVSASEVKELGRARRIMAVRTAPEPAAPAPEPGPAPVATASTNAPPTRELAPEEARTVSRGTLWPGSLVTFTLDESDVVASLDREVTGPVTVTGHIYPGFRPDLGSNRHAILLDSVIRDAEGAEVAAKADVTVQALPERVLLTPAGHRDDLRPELRDVTQVRVGDLVAGGGDRGEEVTSVAHAVNPRGATTFFTRDVTKGTANSFTLLHRDGLSVVPRERRLPEDVAPLFGEHINRHNVLAETRTVLESHTALAEAAALQWPDGDGPQTELRLLRDAIGNIDPLPNGADEYRANARAMTVAETAAMRLFAQSPHEARYQGRIGRPLHELRQHLDIQAHKLSAVATRLEERAKQRSMQTPPAPAPDTSTPEVPKPEKPGQEPASSPESAPGKETGPVAGAPLFLKVAPPNVDAVPALNGTAYTEDAEHEMRTDVELLEQAFEAWLQHPVVQPYIAQDRAARPNGFGEPDNPAAELHLAYGRAWTALQGSALAGGSHEILRKIHAVAAWSTALEPVMGEDVRPLLAAVGDAAQRLAARTQATIVAFASGAQSGTGPQPEGAAPGELGLFGDPAQGPAEPETATDSGVVPAEERRGAQLQAALAQGETIAPVSFTERREPAAGWILTTAGGHTFRLRPETHSLRDEDQWEAGHDTDGSYWWAMNLEDRPLNAVLARIREDSATRTRFASLWARYGHLTEETPQFSTTTDRVQLDEGVYLVSRFGRIGLIASCRWGWEHLTDPDGAEGHTGEDWSRRGPDHRQYVAEWKIWNRAQDAIANARLRVVARLTDDMADTPDAYCDASQPYVGKCSAKRSGGRYTVAVDTDQGSEIGCYTVCARCLSHRLLADEERQIDHHDMLSLVRTLAKGDPKRGDLHWKQWPDRAAELGGQMLSAALDAGETAPWPAQALAGQLLAEACEAGDDRAMREARAEVKAAGGNAGAQKRAADEALAARQDRAALIARRGATDMGTANEADGAAIAILGLAGWGVEGSSARPEPAEKATPEVVNVDTLTVSPQVRNGEPSSYEFDVTGPGLTVGAYKITHDAQGKGARGIIWRAYWHGVEPSGRWDVISIGSGEGKSAALAAVADHAAQTGGGLVAGFTAARRMHYDAGLWLLPDVGESEAIQYHPDGSWTITAETGAQYTVRREWRGRDATNDLAPLLIEDQTGTLVASCTAVDSYMSAWAPMLDRLRLHATAVADGVQHATAVTLGGPGRDWVEAWCVCSWTERTDAAKHADRTPAGEALALAHRQEASAGDGAPAAAELPELDVVLLDVDVPPLDPAEPYDTDEEAQADIDRLGEAFARWDALPTVQRYHEADRQQRPDGTGSPTNPVAQLAAAYRNAGQSLRDGPAGSPDDLVRQVHTVAVWSGALEPVVDEDLRGPLGDVREAATLLASRSHATVEAFEAELAALSKNPEQESPAAEAAPVEQVPVAVDDGQATPAGATTRPGPAPAPPSPGAEETAPASQPANEPTTPAAEQQDTSAPARETSREPGQEDFAADEPQPPEATADDAALDVEDPPVPRSYTEVFPLSADAAYQLHLTGLDGQPPGEGELRFGETTIAAVRLSVHGRWFARLSVEGLPADLTRLNESPQDAAEQGAILFASLTGTPYGTPPGPAVDNGTLTQVDVLRGELRDAAQGHLHNITVAVARVNPDYTQIPQFQVLSARLDDLAAAESGAHGSRQMAANLDAVQQAARDWGGTLPEDPVLDERQHLAYPLAHLLHDTTRLHARLQATLDAAQTERTAATAVPAEPGREETVQQAPSPAAPKPVRGPVVVIGLREDGEGQLVAEVSTATATQALVVPGVAPADLPGVSLPVRVDVPMLVRPAQQAEHLVSDDETQTWLAAHLVDGPLAQAWSTDMVRAALVAGARDVLLEGMAPAVEEIAEWLTATAAEHDGLIQAAHAASSVDAFALAFTRAADDLVADVGSEFLVWRYLGDSEGNRRLDVLALATPGAYEQLRALPAPVLAPGAELTAPITETPEDPTMATPAHDDVPPEERAAGEAPQPARPVALVQLRQWGGGTLLARVTTPNSTRARTIGPGPLRRDGLPELALPVTAEVPLPSRTDPRAETLVQGAETEQWLSEHLEGGPMEPALKVREVETGLGDLLRDVLLEDMAPSAGEIATWLAGALAENEDLLHAAHKASLEDFTRQDGFARAADNLVANNESAALRWAYSRRNEGGRNEVLALAAPDAYERLRAKELPQPSTTEPLPPREPAEAEESTQGQSEDRPAENGDGALDGGRILDADSRYRLQLSAVDGEGPREGNLLYGNAAVAAVRLSADGRWFARLTVDGSPADITPLTGSPQDAAHQGAIMFAITTGEPFGDRPVAADARGGLSRADVLRRELSDAAEQHLRIITVAAARVNRNYAYNPQFLVLNDRLGTLRATDVDSHGSWQMTDSLEAIRQAAIAWGGALPQDPTVQERQLLAFPLMNLLHDATRLHGRLQATLDAEQADRAAAREQEAALASAAAEPARDDSTQQTPAPEPVPAPEPAPTVEPPSFERAVDGPSTDQPAPLADVPEDPGMATPARDNVPPRRPAGGAQRPAGPKVTLQLRRGAAGAVVARVSTLDGFRRSKQIQPVRGREGLLSDLPLPIKVEVPMITRAESQADELVQGTETNRWLSTHLEGGPMGSAWGVGEVRWHLGDLARDVLRDSMAPTVEEIASWLLTESAEDENLLRAAHRNNFRDFAQYHFRAAADYLVRGKGSPVWFWTYHEQTEDRRDEVLDLAAPEVYAQLCAKELPQPNPEEDVAAAGVYVDGEFFWPGEEPAPVTDEANAQPASEPEAEGAAVASEDPPAEAPAPQEPSSPESGAADQTAEPSTPQDRPAGKRGGSWDGDDDLYADLSLPGDLPLHADDSTDDWSNRFAWENVNLTSEFEVVTAAWDEHVPADQGTSEELLADIQADLAELQHLLADIVAEAEFSPEAPTAAVEPAAPAAEPAPVTEAAPAPGEQEETTAERDPQEEADAVNTALRQADLHAPALQDLPEWQHIQTVRGAFGNLMNVIKDRAGEHFGQLMKDRGVSDFVRHVSLRICEKAADWAQAGADRLRRDDERSTEQRGGPLPSADALLRLGDAALQYSGNTRLTPPPANPAFNANGIPEMRQMSEALNHPSPGIKRVSAAAARGRSTTTGKRPVKGAKKPAAGSEQAGHLRRRGDQQTNKPKQR